MEKGIILDTAMEALELVQKNNEWTTRYTGYAQAIFANLDTIAVVRKGFREWSPFKVYLNITNAKNTTSGVCFELRYLGQTVAELICKDNNVSGLYIRTKVSGKKYDENNFRDFDCLLSLDMVKWTGEEAKAFRSFFRGREPIRNGSKKGNEEHRIESLLLSEFSKLKSTQKALTHIQPVKIAKVRFPMPTPLSASNHKHLRYSGRSGGGIDILARIGQNSSTTKLCIIEVKDENTTKEPPAEVIKQAVAYAVFIRELLRSGTGNDWWRLFGFQSKLPKKLTLLAACAMPSNGNDDHSLENAEIDVEGDTIQLHYLYYTEQDNNIVNINTSLNK